jgi:5'-methylthioinosine phosphorylase
LASLPARFCSARPPHLVNYRANLWALREQGVSDVVSVATVGGIRADLIPGSLVVPDQVLDYTHGRDYTFFGNRNTSYRNIDFTLPYSSKLRSRILRGAEQVQQPCLDGGVYATTQGPRLDSIAEINRYQRDGADMVGMTGMPETALAKELDMSYATIAVVVNYAAGRGDSQISINMEGVNATARNAMDSVRAILECVVNCEDEDGNGN